MATGAVSHYASLIGSRTVNDPAGTNAAKALIDGTHLLMTKTEGFMPDFGAGYSDAEIAAAGQLSDRPFRCYCLEADACRHRQSAPGKLTVDSKKACPLWVTSGSRGASAMRPVFPQQQTSLGSVGTCP